MPKTKNLKPETRSLIVHIGRKLQGKKIAIKNLDIGASPKVKYSEIRDAIGTNHDEGHHNKLDRRAIKRWWDRETSHFLNTDHVQEDQQILRLAKKEQFRK